MLRAAASDSWMVWYVKRTVYRLWRLRRFIVLSSVIPPVALFLSMRFAALQDPIFEQTLDSLPMEVLFANYAIAILLIAAFFQTAVHGAFKMMIAFSVGLVVLPILWEYSAHFGDDRAKETLGLLIPSLLVLFLVLISPLNPLKHFTYPGGVPIRHAVRVKRAVEDVFVARTYTDRAETWDEMIERVQADLIHPRHYKVKYKCNLELPVRVLSMVKNREIVLEIDNSSYDAGIEVITERVYGEGQESVLEMNGVLTGASLELILFTWLRDVYADYNTYFRDRMEGRPSLAIHASNVSLWDNKSNPADDFPFPV